jgi:hypothetical protein
MGLFFELRDVIVNVNKIKEVGIARKDALRITFDDDSTEVYGTYGDADSAAENLGKTIIQVIPCTAPMYNVYRNKDEKGIYHNERVYFLALCADGAVRSLSGDDLHMELAENATNFVGVYGKERLKDFPESENEDF